MGVIEEVFLESEWEDVEQARSARDVRAAQLQAQGLVCSCETLYRITDGYRVFAVTAREEELIEEAGMGQAFKKKIGSSRMRGEDGKPDREADIYAFFAQERRVGSELLIRAAQNRRTKRLEVSEEVEPLFKVVEGSEVVGEVELQMQRTPRRKAREARLTVRVAEVWLKPPAHLGQLEEIRMWAVLAEEENPPPGERGVRWLLLSTKEVKDYAGACECLDATL